MHFFTKAAFAAPASALPSLLTAAVSQHFLIAAVLAAPASGLPSLLTASFLQEPPCASAGLTGKNKAVAAAEHASVARVVTIRVIGRLLVTHRAELTTRIDPGKSPAVRVGQETLRHALSFF